MVWKSASLIPREAWSRYLEGSKDLIGDWKDLKCGNYNKVTKKCGGVRPSVLALTRVNLGSGYLSPLFTRLRHMPGSAVAARIRSGCPVNEAARCGLAA